MKALETTSIAQFCAVIRAREGRSLHEFASDTGSGFGWISRIERGLVNQPMVYLKQLKPYLSRPEVEHAITLMANQLRQELMAG